MKFLRACLLIIAIACTAQAGDMQFGYANPTPDIGTELIVFLSLLF
jgi:hypothetical protein